MEPIKFAESNRELQKPVGMTDEECSSLPTFTDGKQSISCWKPSLKERLSILFHGRVWLSVCSGVTQPPVWLSGAKTVFEKPQKESEGEK
jgi:hypothetical protein